MKFRIAHIFCGIGGKGLGAKEALARFGDHEATFETIGGIDIVLQSFPHLFKGTPLVLAGTGHTRWREAIGNAVPPAASRAIGEQLFRALLIASLSAFALESTPIWVSPSQEAA